MSIPSLAIMLTWSVFTEQHVLDPFLGDKALGLIFALFVSCVNATMLNVAVLYVIKDLGAVASNLAAQLKGILIILGGVAMLGESVAMQQIGGYGVIVGGVYWYNSIEKKAKEEAKDEK